MTEAAAEQVAPGEADRPPTLASVLREALSRHNGQVLRGLVRVALAKALEADVRFWKEVCDRADDQSSEPAGGGMHLPHDYGDYAEWEARQEGGPEGPVRRERRALPPGRTEVAE